MLTGQVTEQCILYSALNAYVRHFEVIVPSDVVAHIDADLGSAALRMMENNMRASVIGAADCLELSEVFLCGPVSSTGLGACASTWLVPCHDNRGSGSAT